MEEKVRRKSERKIYDPENKMKVNIIKNINV